MPGSRPRRVYRRAGLRGRAREVGPALPNHIGKQGPKLGQAEGLVQVGPVERLEEREGVAPDRVAGAEDQAPRQRGVASRQLFVELAAARTEASADLR